MRPPWRSTIRLHIAKPMPVPGFQFCHVGNHCFVGFRRMDNLGALIQKRNWVDAKTYIHGPLGDLRGSMKSVSAILLPKSQAQAVDLTKSLFADLVNVDLAIKDLDFPKVTSSYEKAVNDFDAFLQLIPKA